MGPMGGDELMELSSVDKRILASCILGVDITEVFSPERIAKLAARFGLVPGASMDLTNGWDFNRAEDRARAWKNIRETQPYLIIGSPPCTLFSNLQELNKHVHRDNPIWLANFEEEKRKACRHIEFCIQLYRHQLRQGRHFLHEHPWGASSWRLDSVVEMMQDGRVFTVESHQCRFGLDSHISSKDGARGPVKKPTGFMTSARCIATQLNKLCDGRHTHVHLVGGRAAAAQVYPDELCRAILRGVVRQKALEKEGQISTPVMDGPQLRGFMSSLGIRLVGGISSTVIERSSGNVPSGSWPGNWCDYVHEQDGGDDKFGTRPQRGIEMLAKELESLTFRDGIAMAKDDVTGTVLVPELVRLARAEEMSYFKKLGVYDVVPRSDALRTGGKVIGTRWVDVNKGDSTNPNCRSRLVGREFNVGRDDTLYAATPPLEALRLILSHAGMWIPGRNGERKAVMINDVRRAYFYARATRDLYIEIPREDPDAGPNVLGKLKLCLYGTRDAAKGWQEELSAHLEKIGFTRGIGHPSVFHHKERQIMTLVHGDDYVSTGLQTDLDWLETELSKAYEIQTQKVGPGSNQDKEGKVLNRIVRCTGDGWEYEADPRHAELIVEQLGVSGSRTLTSPGVDGSAEEDTPEDIAIYGLDATRFRGVAARCNYLAMDRPDIQFATKEICREMSSPTTGSLRRLVRIGQYLCGRPRLVWKYKMQEFCQLIDVYSDSDWAGCRRARKSSSGGSIMLGAHCLKTWSKTQAIIARSSAEAELYGVVRGATEGLGMITLMRDMGVDAKLQLHLDAAAAKGIIERKGLSKVRHVDVNVLWLQETCARKDIPLFKVPGDLNPADLMTKHLSQGKIDKNVLTMQMEYAEGRSGKAANLHSVEVSKAKSSWDKIRKTGHEKRGGDDWISNGKGGVWHRQHTTPRVSLFTPYKVSKGPANRIPLSHVRFTCGVTESGKSFEFHDDWTLPDRKHKVLEEPWIGYSVFVERSASNESVQASRIIEGRNLRDNRGAWADCSGDET